MSNQFLNRFKEICSEIDKVVKPAETTPEIRRDDVLARYNVHRRSLPVGLDRPVAYFLTRDEADLLIRRLKTKVTKDGIVIYYDVVRNDGEGSGVFHNEGAITKTEGSDSAPIEIVTDWVG